MKIEIDKGDLLGGTIVGLVTGLGVGLLLAPGRGQAVDKLQRNELAQRIAASGPLILEAGLVLLSQTRPVLGRLAWGIVSLAGRLRPREGTV